MGNLARLLQHRFIETCPRGWRCVPEKRILDARLEKVLGFAPRADVLLERQDGSRRLWIEFEISRADPVANHAKFATAHLFEPRPSTDVFVSMISTHVVRGRSNLAAATIYLMRAIGMSAFQTSLLPDLAPRAVHALNQRPLSALLAETSLATEPEIQRALSVSETFTKSQGHRIHFAANLFEVMLNARAWNTAASTPDGGRIWGRRVVTFFVYDCQDEAFAPSKFCAFVPIHLGQAVSASSISMDIETYASLDELETRFDGNIARRHLTTHLSMLPVPIEKAPPEVVRSFRAWHQRFSDRITIHPRGPVLLLPPTWWN